MPKYYSKEISKSPRIDILKNALFANKPRIEADRAVLLTESYKATEHLPIIERRARAFSHILHNLPITIRDNELVVGSATVMPRSTQTFPEFSFSWLEDEFETVDELSRVSGVKCPEQLANLKGKEPRFTDICKKPEMTEVVFKMLGI